MVKGQPITQLLQRPCSLSALGSTCDVILCVQVPAPPLPLAEVQPLPLAVRLAVRSAALQAAQCRRCRQRAARQMCLGGAQASA